MKEEIDFGIKDYKTIKSSKKIMKIKENFNRNLKELKKKSKSIVGYGSPAKATTALNFFGVSNEIDFILEDNKLKQGKILPGVNIPIYSRKKLKKNNSTILVLAWNFFDEIKKNNQDLSKNFVNIKSLENTKI